jgi:hypothetical protein
MQHICMYNVGVQLYRVFWLFGTTPNQKYGNSYCIHLHHFEDFPFIFLYLIPDKNKNMVTYYTY